MPPASAAASAAFLSRPYASAAAVGSLMMRFTSSPAIAPAYLVAVRWPSLKYAGTVTTARVTGWPRYASAVVFILTSTMAEISSGANVLVSPLKTTWIMGASSLPAVTVKGKRLRSSAMAWSFMLRPMRRFASYTVLLGLEAACACAAAPMRRSCSVKATIDGVVLEPSEFWMISTRSFCHTPTHEYVVPRSMPMMVPLSVLGAEPAAPPAPPAVLSAASLAASSSGEPPACLAAAVCACTRPSVKLALAGSTLRPSAYAAAASWKRPAANCAAPRRPKPLPYLGSTCVAFLASATAASLLPADRYAAERLE